jgi:hypothetical protein
MGIVVAFAVPLLLVLAAPGTLGALRERDDRSRY